MKPLILCYERLCRIRRVLDQLGGKASVRDLCRSYAIRDWEIKQATNLGWLTVIQRKPRTGRPSYVVQFCDVTNAKCPPLRRFIEKEISFRHCLFAQHSVTTCVYRGMPQLGFPGISTEYIAIYKPRSRSGAFASTSRLLRREDVQAVQRWFCALVAGEIPRSERMPRTTSAIWQRMRDLRNSRPETVQSSLE